MTALAQAMELVELDPKLVRDEAGVEVTLDICRLEDCTHSDTRT